MGLSKIINYLNFVISLTTVIVLYTFVIQIFPDKHSKTYPEQIHVNLYIDREFTEDEQEIIMTAALEWSTATNHIVEYDIIQLPTKDAIELDDSLIIVKYSPDNPRIILMDANENKTLGFYEGHDGPIPYIALVSDRLDLEIDYKEVVLHEMGHSLGLQHIKGEDGWNTLMYPYTDLGADHITEKDLEEFCKLYHCDVSKLKH